MLRVAVVIALVSVSLCEFDPELHAKYLSMPHEEFVEHFNKHNYNFKIGSSPHQLSSHITCVIIDKEFYKKLPKVHHGLEAMATAPVNFDARQQWSNCATIGEVYNQGTCGSCWAFGTATVASDRTCIHTGLNVRLAEQDFDCLTQNRCDGFQADKAFQYWIDKGLVTQECKPYDEQTFWHDPSCVTQCINGADYNGDKHYGESVYGVSSDNDQIMAEISQNGPIEASMNVYDDFRNYTSGIYEHKYGTTIVHHSVKLIGYGVENSVQFWLGANSWGSNWGEYGIFKVKRYTADLQIEDHLMGVMPRK